MCSGSACTCGDVVYNKPKVIQIDGLDVTVFINKNIFIITVVASLTVTHMRSHATILVSSRDSLRINLPGVVRTLLISLSGVSFE